MESRQINFSEFLGDLRIPGFFDLTEETDLYDRLFEKYLMPVEQLERYSYPVQDPGYPTMKKAPLDEYGRKQQLKEFASTRTCHRCAKVYSVDPYTSMPLKNPDFCLHHHGKLRHDQDLQAERYNCCKGSPGDSGCSLSMCHVHEGNLEMANYKGFVETKSKPERDPNKHGVYALDCEMSYTTRGKELTKITIINHNSELVYEKLVKPKNPILDYCTRFNGIKAGDLDSVTTTLEDVQKDLLEMFSSKTILIGHSLDNDMNVLKIFHKCFVDTTYLFPDRRGLPYKKALKTLMSRILKTSFRETGEHDSKEDANAALRLVLWKAEKELFG